MGISDAQETKKWEFLRGKDVTIGISNRKNIKKMFICYRQETEEGNF